ncbi:hypothetical protein FCK90_14400 [Kocuria coralli]|uniref:Uncharacterized protein n=1 Tax=Kocuria coralli TaxID=1461025 RepID=A0A5J5KVT8_9MICC|nr:hypothetical protein [Kocuria coralli]KAA9393016.1 hypothetical protein FCK90_14400 [Kocuria coralli]
MSSTFMQAANAAGIVKLPSIWGYETIPGTPGRPAEYAKGTPREGFLAHMLRLGWITRDEQRTYEVSELGLALLRGHEAPHEDEYDVLVLGGEDKALDYSRAIDHIAERGQAMIVDAYLDVQQISDLLQYTSVNKFLVTNKPREDRRRLKLGVYLKTWKRANGDTDKELRMASLHDRWIVGDTDFHILGASLNGIGKYATTLCKVQGSAERELRAEAQSLWDTASVIVEANPVTGPGPTSAP